ncbi:hypothetical protein [Sphingomonas sp. KR3-1]|uniref:hypothetical protein n=1 Tax=Sphingomonas sp. KR3-1 TaxID=3156611 RepID=UPI0032B4DF46
MQYLQKYNPLRAFGDLRRWLATRKPYELWFMMLAMLITLVILWMFVKDSNVATPYKRDIIYVQQWRLDRSDADIKAQQAKDLPEELKRKAAFEAAQKKRQAEFKKYDDWLTKHGF